MQRNKMVDLLSIEGFKIKKKQSEKEISIATVT